MKFLCGEDNKLKVHPGTCKCTSQFEPADVGSSIHVMYIAEVTNTKRLCYRKVEVSAITQPKKTQKHEILHQTAS